MSTQNNIESYDVRFPSLDQIVESFESACATSADMAVDSFLPSADHPNYETICAELLCVDMERRWTRGHRSDLNAYQDRYPLLLKRDSIVAKVAFEEYRLRRLAGERVWPADYSTRYGVDTAHWPSPPLADVGDDPSSLSIAAKAEDTSLGGSTALGRSAILRSSIVPDALAPGDRLLDFEIVEPLGEGRFGRVYLARQQSLARRPVVLKITTDVWSDSNRLARLQHTHVVPVYSVHPDPPRQIVCMPYFGRHTLADFLPAGKHPDGLASGRQFVSRLLPPSDTNVYTCTRLPVSAELSLPTPWCALSHEQLCLSITARIADGLAHAHERGILHRDLKPANVLITDDGQPMILDFNLAADTTAERPSVWVGGTLPYMSPEHLSALLHEAVVDARSDIYSLGVVLYQMLSGQLPFATPTGEMRALVPQLIAARRTVPAVSSGCPGLSPAAEAIVARCLATQPADRYQSAQHLKEDIERHLQDLPLRHAPNRSWRERLSKWRRRHPKVTSLASLAAVAALLIFAVLGLLIVRNRQLAHLQADIAYRQFEDMARGAAAPLRTLSLDDEGLQAGAREADGAMSIFDFPQADWESRSLFRWLPPRDQSAVREQLGHLCFLLSNYHGQRSRYLHDGAEQRAAQQQATDFNRRAQRLAISGETMAMLRAQEKALLDRSLKLDEHDPRHDYSAETLPRFETLVEQDLQDVERSLELGRCYTQLGRFRDAELCYTRCQALWPQSPWPVYFRGLCRLETKDYLRAEQDFSDVLQKQPELASAYVNRALAREGLGRAAEAIGDITFAIEHLKVPNSRLYLIRAKLWQHVGDKARADEDRAFGLSMTPTDESGWIARALARAVTDPAAARADLELARTRFPRSRRVLQNLAHVLSDRLQLTEEAIPVLDEMLSLAPDNPTALAGRGVLHARLGQRAQAERDARSALALDRSPSTQYQLASIYALLANGPAAAAEDRDIGLTYLTAAVRGGLHWADIAVRDPDLRSLYELAAFQSLTQAAQTVRGTAGTGPVMTQNN